MTANAKFKIRRGDQVVVITGREKGRTGEVREVQRDKQRVLIQGVNMVTKHMRPSQDGPGRVEQIEAPIHISNVAHIDPGTSNKPTRIGYAMEGETKTRIARKSGKAIAVPRLARDVAKKTGKDTKAKAKAKTQDRGSP